ncbi:MAG: bile acid:sodium symporter [Verrucomicrobiales bacterium]|nr:bile acid:sodium symporter [Verrucomicrobiales bacterium]
MSETLHLTLKVSLVLFMVGNLLDMGLRLNLSEAIRGLRDLRFVILTLFWGFGVLPAVGWLLTRMLPLDPPLATGLLLLSMTPCAPFLPPMAERAGADRGYTAAFMLVASVVTVAYLPVAVPRWVGGLSVDAGTIARPLVLFLLIPLLAGLALQHHSRPWSARVHPVVKFVTGVDTLLMLLLCLTLYGRGFLGLFGTYAIGAQLIFFTTATVLPALFGFGLPPAQRCVLSLGMATRNLGAAFAPLFAVQSADRRAIVMVALGVLMQSAFSFASATWFGRRQRTLSPGPTARDTANPDTPRS